jgi:hypothetical protein
MTENLLVRLINKARETIATIEDSYRRESLSEAIYDAEKLVPEWRNPYKHRRELAIKTLRIVVVFGEYGVFD